MKDSKIHMNKPPLSESEINNAKDFDKVLSGAGDPDPKPKASNNKFKLIIGGAIVALVGCALWFLPSKDENNTTAKEKIDLSTFNINPLLKGVDIPTDSYNILAENGGNFTTSVGTNIIVPPNAFLDKEGKPVVGEVVLKFREFHDVPSIFAAGINMTYDSAGTEYHFESAGMFEIDGYQNGEKLFTNPNELISVELASNQPGDYFNIYYQDPKNGWEFIRKDTASLNQIVAPIADSNVIAAKEAELAQLKKDISKAEKKFKKTLKKQGIMMPEKANDELYAMKIAFTNAEFPELAPYKNIVFEITEANEDFDPKLAQQEWKGIELKKNLLGVYVMHLYGKTKEKLFVRPVFAGENIENANQTFEKLFEEYTSKSDGRLAEDREELKTMAQIYQTTQQEVIDAYNASLGYNANQDKVWNQTDKVKRVFTVANFGMWNSDCPANLPKGQEAYPVFVNEENEKDTLTFSTMYIAEYGNNALYTYWGDWGNKDLLDEEAGKKRIFENPLFTFNPQKETVVWFVTKKGNVAVITPDKLKKVTFNKGNTTIKMKVHKAVGDVKAIKKLLGWK